jgi:hypothetical protein
VFKIIQS